MSHIQIRATSQKEGQGPGKVSGLSQTSGSLWFTGGAPFAADAHRADGINLNVAKVMKKVITMFFFTFFNIYYISILNVGVPMSNKELRHENKDDHDYNWFCN